MQGHFWNHTLLESEERVPVPALKESMLLHRSLDRESLPSKYNLSRQAFLKNILSTMLLQLFQFSPFTLLCLRTEAYLCKRQAVVLATPSTAYATHTLGYLDLPASFGPQFYYRLFSCPPSYSVWRDHWG